MPGTVLSMQNILLGQRKVMQIRQRETLSHQRAIIHEICLSSAQWSNLSASSISKDVFVDLLALSLSLSSSQVVSARFQLSLSFISFPFSTGCVQFKVELFEVRRHFMI